MRSPQNCMFVWSSKITSLVTGARPQQANLALAGLSAAFGVGRLVAVLWLRWLGSRGTIWLCCTMAIFGGSFALASRQFPPMTAGILFIGLGLSAIFPTVLGLAADRFPKETGTVFGAILSVALVGGAAGPRLAARVAEIRPADVFWIPIVAGAAVAILRNDANFAVALNCGIGSSSLNALVNAFDRLHVVLGANSSVCGLK